MGWGREEEEGTVSVARKSMGASTRLPPSLVPSTLLHRLLSFLRLTLLLQILVHMLHRPPHLVPLSFEAESDVRALKRKGCDLSIFEEPFVVLGGEDESSVTGFTRSSCTT